MTLLTYVAAILDRDLRALRREVEAYSDERELWVRVPGITNVGGNLVLHLAGNLQYYIGTVLGRTGYVRDRPAEFARHDVPRAELLREIEAARDAVKATLEKPVDVDAEFPESILGMRVRTGDYLIHLATHFAYHLGQLDYHRRVVTKHDKGIDAVRPSELSSAQ
ncbi:MAG TPA: DinB family protein [Gemmatimonadales bacterium]|nr:DinB family protein [Gemmatimonadales bacterium]